MYIQPGYRDEPDMDNDFNPAAEKLELQLAEARDWFSEIVGILYGRKPFDLGELENSLDELGAYLEYKVPNTNIRITNT